MSAATWEAIGVILTGLGLIGAGLRWGIQTRRDSKKEAEAALQVRLAGLVEAATKTNELRDTKRELVEMEKSRDYYRRAFEGAQQEIRELRRETRDNK